MKTKKLKSTVCVLIICSLVLDLFSGCGTKKKETETQTENALVTTYFVTDELNVVEDNYRTCYEIFVYSFYDSDGNGIGDLNGVTKKLDYINDGDDSTTTDLGCNEIWLMPIMHSNTYHKYDVIDYYSVDGQYGSMEDFEALIAECHARGINVILDFVMNHSSSANPWFQDACDYLEGLSEGEEPDPAECPYVEYYNFNKEGGTGYYQVGDSQWYYEAQFWSEMPDFNLENETVREEFTNIAQFWIDKGVDGFRLDAVTSYVTGNSDSNVEILSWFNETVKSMDPDCYVVGEAWTYYSEYASYYESGIDSFFNFDFAGADGVIAKVLTGSAKNGASSYGSMVQTVYEEIAKYSDTAIDAPFFVNHDMARAAGYFPGDDGSKLKMAQAMNLLMSGNAFLYYGEEIGMKGSGKDENKRLAMYWSSESGAEGICLGPEDADATEMKYGSVLEQSEDESSILSFVKNLIKIRNQYPEIARGTEEFVSDLSDDKVCVIKKNYGEEICYIVYNVSEEAVTFDKSALDTQNVVAALSAGGDTFDTNEFSETSVTMPAYSVMILK